MTNKIMNSRRFKSPIHKTLLIFCLMLFGLSVNSFAAPGDLDLSFGNGGKVVTRVEDRFSIGTAVTIQNDGKIITVGYTAGAGINKLIVIRYNLDGTLDAGFNGNGIVIALSDGNIIAPTSVAMQPDGKIVIAGFGFKFKGGYSDFFVVRLNSDGSSDASFNGNGLVKTHITSLDNFANAVIVQPDGKIIVAGYGNERGGIYNITIVVRYNSDGSLDTTFNGNGKFISPSSIGENVAYDAVLQSDGKIVLAGVNNYYNFALLRLNQNGTVDGSFNGSGLVVTSFDGNTSQANALTIQPDGKIVAVGSAAGLGFAIARYNPDGILDTTFDGDGKVTTVISPYLNEAADVIVQNNGKIIVGGNAEYIINSANSTISKYAFARYNSDGSPDNTFSNDGQTTIAVRDNDELSEIAIQQDGKIVAVGSTKRPYNGDSDTALIRLQNGEFAANKPMFDFDGDGKSDISVFRPSSGVWYLLNSTSGFTAAQFGASTDKLVPGDYDGDGKTDIAVYRAGTWYLNRTLEGFTGIVFGESSDIPQPADFDGDGKTDLAVYRPSNGVWYVLRIGISHYEYKFGVSTDKPVVSDYDGDGKADYAVYRPSNGTWYLQRSQLGYTGVQFGETTDKPVPADYDGDGKIDVAVFRPSNGVWYLNRSTQGFTGIQFGIATDLPTPADYDGDGKADIAVFRNGTWYLQQTTAGFTGVGFGESTDKPVPNAFVP